VSSPDPVPVPPSGTGTDSGPDDGSGTGTAPGNVPQITVYWRPGCPYCGSLRRGLRRAGLATGEVDIWVHPEAAAFVREHARGNETVPTVDIAGTVLVNPSAARVVEAAAAAGLTVGPHLRRWWRRSPV
jgi:mycoredoxin